MLNYIGIKQSESKQKCDTGFGTVLNYTGVKQMYVQELVDGSFDILLIYIGVKMPDTWLLTYIGIKQGRGKYNHKYEIILYARKLNNVHL